MSTELAPSPPRPDAARALLRRHAGLLALVALLGAVFVAMAWLVPSGRFLRAGNFDGLSFVAPELGLLAVATMIAMLTGGIDLSVVGIANLAGILAGLLFHWAAGASRGPELAGLSVAWVAAGVGCALLTGALAGLVNGLLIARARLTPILATIGSGQVFTGIALVLTGGPAIVGFPSAWQVLGGGSLLGIALPLWVLLGFAVPVALLLSRSLWGRTLILIGSGARAAEFAGLRTARAVVLSYVASGVLAAAAGVLLSARTNAAKSDYGTSYLLQAVLIAVLAGTNPGGGRGSVPAVLLALCTLMLLSSGFQLMRFSNFLVDLIWGVTLLGAMTVGALWRRRR